MSNLTYLFVAFLVTWLVIGGYLWSLGRQVQNLRDEVQALTDEVAMPESEPRAVPEQRTQTGSTQV